MTERGGPMPARDGEPPIDLATVRADDALLDTWSRGASPSPDPDTDPVAGPLAGLFAEWRADLGADLPAFTVADLATLTAGPTVAVDGSRSTNGIDSSLPDIPELRAAAPAGDTDTTETLGSLPDEGDGGRGGRRWGGGAKRARRGGSGGERGARPGAGLRRAFMAVAAGIVVLAGLAIGAQHSGPDSPLWPLTEVLYPEQAHARAAEQAIAEAEQSIATAHYDDARHHLDVATTEANQVDNAGTRQRLLDRITDLREQIPATLPPPEVSPAPPSTQPAPTAQPAPTTDAPGATPPAANPTTGGNGGGGNGDGDGGGQVIPGLPTQILPTTGPGLPLPTKILPTTVPGLPLPTRLP
ncbi:hypothetical protein Dvina_12040 [Dactylosporangium vinaceum]|uniref:Anti-sigma-D factor RsdA sigma factor binding region domain-containing protein n=1 Tax=Dactylosporangium vinaceum TaxID=53362 RepID=A0ABV5MFE9_9ACTN|nr:hypothetical protein [Dactylosporangium vinaceum]UAB98734.1 hypothetical protein Dvina_12040 [Dactylosporangium vinaceum]